MGQDKFELLEMPTHKIINMAFVEQENVTFYGGEKMLSGMCCMICTMQSCVGFSTSVNSTNNCLLYSVVEFAKNNHAAPALEVKEKLYMR